LINADQHLRHISIDGRTFEAANMSIAALLCPAVRLSAFYAAMFLVAGIQLPFWPVWLAARGLSAREIGIVLAAAIWVRVFATPAIGAISDRLGARRAVNGGARRNRSRQLRVLVVRWGFGVLVSLTLVALTAQSALMPLGDTVTLAISRSDGLDYGRIRVWGSVSFILASLVSGAVLWSASGEQVPPLVLGVSALVLLACRRSVAAASAQPIYASVSSRLRGGLVMLAAGELYARCAGWAYLFMAVLSAPGLFGAVGLCLPLPP
jgi:PPP family 3-phenylpropionic acid transporter